VEVKNLIAGLIVVWKRHMHNDVAHKAVLAGLIASNKMDVILSECSGMKQLPRDQAVLILQGAFAYCQAQTAVARHFNNIGHFLFDITYKSHALIHVSFDSFYTPAPTPHLTNFLEKQSILGNHKVFYNIIEYI